MGTPLWGPLVLSSQVGDTRFDLFGFADIPELLTQVPAGPADDIHRALIFVVAVGTLPLAIIIDDDFAIKTAYLAVVAFGVELGILDVVVDKLYDFLQSFQILVHVGDLRIGDAAATGDGLELIFKYQLGKSINVLPYIHMVAVGVIPLVCHIGDVAKTLPIDSSKPVAQAFGRGSIEGKANVGGCFPVITGLP